VPPVPSARSRARSGDVRPGRSPGSDGGALSRSPGLDERAAAIGAGRRSRLRSAGVNDDDPAPVSFPRPAPGQPLFPGLESSVSKLAQPEAGEDRKKKPGVDAVDYFGLIKQPDSAADPEKVDSST